MYFSTILSAGFVAIATVNAQSGYASSSTQLFNPTCGTGAPKAHTYNASNPFPISTYATAVGQPSGMPIPAQNGTGPYSNGTKTTGGATVGPTATSTGVSVVNNTPTGAGASATGSASPSTYTGAASSMNVGMGSLVSLGAVAAFFAAAL